MQARFVLDRRVSSCALVFAISVLGREKPLPLCFLIPLPPEQVGGERGEGQERWDRSFLRQRASGWIDRVRERVAAAAQQPAASRAHIYTT